MTTTLAPPVPSADAIAALAPTGKLAHLADKPKPGQTPESFDNDRHVAEPKLDGWRLLIHRADTTVEIWTRNGKRLDGAMPITAAEILDRFPAGTWLDAEVVAMEVVDGKLITSSSKVGTILGSLPATAAKQEGKLTVMVFDLLAHRNIDARTLRFARRRQLLESIFEKGFDKLLLVPQLRPTTAGFDALLAQGFEGMMIKDREATYAAGQRGYGVIKIKPELEMDVVGIGFKDGKSGWTGLIGSIIFGAFDADGNMVELGSCSGMNMKLRLDMTKHPEKYLGHAIEVHYLERHPTGGFRSPQFKRVRLDKDASDCLLELI